MSILVFLIYIFIRQAATDDTLGMVSPILREQYDEGPKVLLLDEEHRDHWLIAISGWFRTLFVETLRANPTKSTIYKVYINKNCPVKDLLVSFEKYLPCENSMLYQNDIHVSRETMLGEFVDGATIVLIENGAVRNTEPVKIVEESLNDKDKSDLLE